MKVLFIPAYTVYNARYKYGWSRYCNPYDRACFPQIGGLVLLENVPSEQ